MGLLSSLKVFLLVVCLFLFLLPFDKWFYNILLPVSNSNFGTMWAHSADVLGNGLIVIVFFVFISCCYWLLTKRDFYKIIFSCSIAMAISGLLCQVLKIVIGRPRPGMELPSWNIQCFNMASDFHSFPSGHAAAIFSIAFCLGYFIPRLRFLWIFTALFVSFGRVVGQAHFLTDIFAGAVIGFLCAKFSLYSSELFENSTIKNSFNFS